MKQKPKRKKSVILRLLVFGVAVYFIVISIRDVNQYAKAEAEYNRYVKEKQELSLDIERLNALLDSDSHKEIIEKAARERLGFVFSNEEIYIDISGN